MPVGSVPPLLIWGSVLLVCSRRRVSVTLHWMICFVLFKLMCVVDMPCKACASFFLNIIIFPVLLTAMGMHVKDTIYFGYGQTRQKRVSLCKIT